jgi:hypothetical protein
MLGHTYTGCRPQNVGAHVHWVSNSDEAAASENEYRRPISGVCMQVLVV